MMSRANLGRGTGSVSNPEGIFTNLYSDRDPTHLLKIVNKGNFLKHHITDKKF